MRFTEEENLQKIKMRIRRKRIGSISCACFLVLGIFLLFQCSFTIYQKGENVINFQDVTLNTSSSDVSINMVKQNIKEKLSWFPEVALANETVHDELAYKCIDKGCMEEGFEHYELFSSSNEADLLLSISTDNRGPITYWCFGENLESILQDKETSKVAGYEVWLLKNKKTYYPTEEKNEYIMYTKINGYFVYLGIVGDYRDYSEEEFVSFITQFLKDIK